MNIYKPTKEMRTNSLSKTPGGSTITFIFEGHQVEYTNIKNHKAYIRSALSRTKVKPVTILVDGSLYE